MDQGLLVLLLGIIVFLCLLAFFIIMETLFKSWIQGVVRNVEEAAGRSLAIGFVNGLLIGAISLGFWALAENTGIRVLAVVGLILLAALAIGVIFGLTAMAVLISESVLPEKQGWRQLAGGGGLLVLACLTPYIGWFGLFPYVLFRGLGGFVQQVVQAWRARRAANDDRSP